MIRRIKLFAMLLLATFLFTGCAIPVVGSIGGCVNNGRVCGNATNVQPAPVIVIPAQPLFFQPACPANSWWDGRGCRLYVPYQFRQNNCFSGGRMIDGTWYCMDKVSFRELMELTPRNPFDVSGFEET